MAHTMQHPFSGNDITSCSYGAQAVAKAAKVVPPKYKGKPMSQMDLSTKWIKDFDGMPDGTVVDFGWLDAASGVSHRTVFEKKFGKLHRTIYKDGKILDDGPIYGSQTPAETLQEAAHFLTSKGYKPTWKYPADASDGLGVTEASFEKANAVGSMNVVAQKALAGEIPNGTIVAYGEELGDEFRIMWKNNNWRVQRLDDEGDWNHWDAYAGIDHDKMIEEYITGNQDIVWRFKTAKGSAPAVSPSSTSIGAMLDEDAASLFVQIKDDFAAARGINIKGVNKALDEAVFKKIAELTGYTPVEITAKVERYKANGNKLSALKKKQLKSGQKVDATKFAKKETVEQAVADLKSPSVVDSLGVYADEDVAKAYIKAKDHVASLDENPWTLYTPDSNVAFEKAVRQYMKEELGVNVDAQRLKQQIANYISSDGKLSVLKKKMVKAGEMEKKADTLKTPKDKFDFLKKTQTKGDDQISVGGKTLKKNPGSPTAEELADLRYTPNGSKIYQFSEYEEESLYNSLKPGSYLTSSPEELYGKFVKYQGKLRAEGKDVSILDIVRAFDRIGAKKFSADNTYLYEKKLIDWASSPIGKKHIKDKYEGEALLRNQPDLPKDSSLFKEITADRAEKMQERMGNWTPEAKSAYRRYTGSQYEDMNDSLRGKQSMSDYIREENKAAWKSMKPSDEDMLIYRGTGADTFGFPKYGDGSHPGAKEFAKFFGETYEEKGFSSTSVGGRAAFDSMPVLLEIEAPKGTYMSFLKPISSFGRENEMLLAPNTHYKILRVTERNGQVVLRVRVVNSEPYKGQLG